MKLPRFSISNLMIVVGLVAVILGDVQVARNGPGRIFEAYGLTFIGLALQVGLLCFCRSRSDVWRPFWGGFVSFSLLAAITPMCIDKFSGTGVAETGYVKRYLDFADDCLGSIVFEVIKDRRWQGALTSVLWDERMFNYDLAWFFPQTAVALLGGLATSVVIKRWHKRHQARIASSTAGGTVA